MPVARGLEVFRRRRRSTPGVLEQHPRRSDRDRTTFAERRGERVDRLRRLCCGTVLGIPRTPQGGRQGCQTPRGSMVGLSPAAAWFEGWRSWVPRRH